MALVIIIDVLLVIILTMISVRRGLEEALPVFAFWITLLPIDSLIQLPGFFDLTTHRVAVMTVTILYLVLRKKILSPILHTPLRYLILMQIAWSIISAFNSVIVPISVKGAFAEVLDYYLLYLIITRTVSHVRTIRRIVFAVVAAMVVCSVFGFVETYYSWTIMSVFPPVVHRFTTGGTLAIDMERGLRVQSTFSHPILFGGTLVLAISSALYLLSTTQRTVDKVFLWAGIVLMFLNIYKTTSRGPWIALLFSLLLWFILGQGRIRRHLLVIAVLILCGLVIRPGVWETIKNVYLSTADPESPMGESYQYRYALFRVGQKAIQKDIGRALWGYGSGSFYYLGLEGDFQGKTTTFESCDSSWTELMVERGYIGLFITILLLFVPASVALRNWLRSGVRDNTSLLLLINMLAYYFLMTNVAIYSWGQQGYLLWILIALSLVYRSVRRAEKSTHDSRGWVLEGEKTQLVEAAARCRVDAESVVPGSCCDTNMALAKRKVIKREMSDLQKRRPERCWSC